MKCGYTGTCINAKNECYDTDTMDGCDNFSLKYSPKGRSSGLTSGYMRKEFEIWAENYGWRIDRSHFDGKTPVNEMMDPAWQAWKAAIDKMRSI